MKIKFNMANSVQDYYKENYITLDVENFVKEKSSAFNKHVTNLKQFHTKTHQIKDNPDTFRVLHNSQKLISECDINLSSLVFDLGDKLHNIIVLTLTDVRKDECLYFGTIYSGDVNNDLYKEYENILSKIPTDKGQILIHEDVTRNSGLYKHEVERMADNKVQADLSEDLSPTEQITMSTPTDIFKFYSDKTSDIRLRIKRDEVYNNSVSRNTTIKINSEEILENLKNILETYKQSYFCKNRDKSSYYNWNSVGITPTDMCVISFQISMDAVNADVVPFTQDDTYNIFKDIVEQIAAVKLEKIVEKARIKVESEDYSKRQLTSLSFGECCHRMFRVNSDFGDNYQEFKKCYDRMDDCSNDIFALGLIQSHLEAGYGDVYVNGWSDVVNNALYGLSSLHYNFSDQSETKPIHSVVNLSYNDIATFDINSIGDIKENLRNVSVYEYRSNPDINNSHLVKSLVDYVTDEYGDEHISMTDYKINRVVRELCIDYIYSKIKINIDKVEEMFGKVKNVLVDFDNNATSQINKLLSAVSEDPDNTDVSVYERINEIKKMKNDIKLIPFILDGTVARMRHKDVKNMKDLCEIPNDEAYDTVDIIVRSIGVLKGHNTPEAFINVVSKLK